jgi:small conductance mechanosensitive channel
MWKVTLADVLHKLEIVSWRIASAALVLFVGIIIARWLAKIASGQLRKRNLDPTIVHFADNAIQVVLYGVVIIDTLHRLGVENSSLIAIVGAAGFGIGLALKNQLANVSAGLLMVIFQPFKVGHYILIGKTEGTVEKIELMSTQIRTPDNVISIIPNSKLMSGQILNYSIKDSRRLIIFVSVSYEADLKKVREVLQEIIDEDERILKDRKPVIAVRSLGETSVRIMLRLWVKSPDHWKVQVDTTEKIKLRFDEAGIPFPASQPVIKQTPG